MIDFSGLPFPPDSPPAGSCVRLERDANAKLAQLVLDPPHRSLAVFDGPLLRDFDLALSDLEREHGGLTGLIVRGKEPLRFCAGADVEAIFAIETAEQARRLARLGQELFQRVHRLSKGGGGPLFVVTAAGGPVPGGAFELALAGDAIVLADHDSTRIGLPEVKLGILPGWGGCQRLPRRAGAVVALDAILTGKLFRAKDALRKGLVDRVTHPEYLDRVARDLALGKERLPKKDHRARQFLVDRNPLVREVVRRRTQATVERTTGGHYPAAFEALDLVLDAARTPLERGLEKEADALARLAISPVAKHLVAIFRASEAQKKLGAGEDGGKAERFRRAAVVGAGVMGAGIASLLAQRGVDVRLSDLARGALDSAFRSHEAAVKKALKRRRVERPDADRAIDRFELSTDPVGFGGCDFVIEAIAEKLGAKRAVLGNFAKLIRADAVIATNTSSLSVDAIAAELDDPSRVVGMHFFNPVDKMPLVEIVRGAKTSDRTVRRVARLALDLGKTPVVVADRPGFVVNRLLGPYLDEALRLFEEGSSPRELDRRARAFGLPMGPFELLDRVGLDIADHAARSLSEAFGERMRASELLAPLLAAGDLGDKTGRGIYVRRGKEKELNPLLQRPPHAPAASELWGPEQMERLILPLLNEAALCLQERVVQSAAELDLAAVFGMGFPPFRGGPLHLIDDRGAHDVIAALERCAAQPTVARRPGGVDRFTPAPILRELARTGGRFHTPAARPTT